MRTWVITVGLIVLVLVFTGSRVIAPPPSEATQLKVAVRAWALIKFDPKGAGAARDLWKDAGSATPQSSRWTYDKTETLRNRVVIERISAVRRLRVKGLSVKPLAGPRGPWDAFAQIGAVDDASLGAAARYIETYYTHVDLYKIHDDFQ